MNPVKRSQKLQEARQAFNDGDIAGAQRICQTLLRDNRADTQALHILAVIASSRGDNRAALDHLTRCVAIEPRNATFHNDLARVHALAGRYAPALACLDRVLALRPGDLQASTDLADILERSGQHAKAWDVMEPRVRAGTVGEEMAPIAMRLLDHAGQTAQAIDLARGLLAAPPARDASRRFLLQTMGRLCEKTGDTRGAFEAFAQAKRSERHRFDPAAHVRDIDALIQTFTPAALARLPRSTQRAEQAVFIACMPRSGSTLVEQVIHAHPLAFGGGENPLLHQAVMGLATTRPAGLPYPACVEHLDTQALDRLAGPCLKAMAELAPDALRVTNKHLLNYLHLGMVALLFPGARVIHVQRNRLDNALACFMTSLAPAVMPWASELPHIGLAMRQYERLMAHWRQTLDLNLLDVQYEDLVEDTETQIRRIVDFCGLPWDERCLRYWEAERVVLTPSYDQVRRPIFRTAVGRWRRYDEFLGPLKQALG